MNNFSQNKSVTIEITKNKNKYYVSIKPYDQVKQVFCNKEKDETYKQVIMFLLGYLANQIDKYPVNNDKLKQIISDLIGIFNLNIRLKMI
jgi:predicted metal-dependent hydrolase